MSAPLRIRGDVSREERRRLAHVSWTEAGARYYVANDDDGTAYVDQRTGPADRRGPVSARHDKLLEKNRVLSRDNENFARQIHELAARERPGYEGVKRAASLATGPEWLNTCDPLTSDDVPALSLVPDPEGSPMLYVVDSRFHPNRVVATIEFSKDSCAPDLRGATHKQRVWLLARLALRAEV